MKFRLPLPRSFRDRAREESAPGAQKLWRVGTLVYTTPAVVGGSVFGGLVNDVVPREVIGRFYGLFRASSLIAGMLFNYFLLEHAEAYYFWLFS